MVAPAHSEGRSTYVFGGVTLTRPLGRAEDITQQVPGIRIGHDVYESLSVLVTFDQLFFGGHGEDIKYQTVLAGLRATPGHGRWRPVFEAMAGLHSMQYPQSKRSNAAGGHLGAGVVVDSSRKPVFASLLVRVTQTGPIAVVENSNEFGIKYVMLDFEVGGRF